LHLLRIVILALLSPLVHNRSQRTFLSIAHATSNSRSFESRGDRGAVARGARNTSRCCCCSAPSSPHMSTSSCITPYVW
jgi:hypothetical protein